MISTYLFSNSKRDIVENWKILNSLEIFLTAVFCSFSADSSEQVLATTESDMPADSEPLLVEVSWLQ